MESKQASFEARKTRQTARINGLVVDVDQLIAEEKGFVDRIMTREDFLDFRQHDRGWDLGQGEVIGPKQLIDLAEACGGDYATMMARQPGWRDHVARVKSADLSRPILVTEEGGIIDGAHRITKMLVERLGHISAKVVRRDALQRYRVMEPKEHDAPHERPEVRIATLADVEDIARIQIESWSATYPNEALGITKEDIQDHFGGLESNTAYRKRLLMRAGPNEKTFLLRKGEKTVGFCRVIRGQEYGHIGELYLDPAYRGERKADPVFTEGMHWLGAQSPLELSVAEHNERAIRFYERFGFRMQGEDDPMTIFTRDGWKDIPMMRMVRDVAESES